MSASLTASSSLLSRDTTGAMTGSAVLLSVDVNAALSGTVDLLLTDYSAIVTASFIEIPCVHYADLPFSTRRRRGL